jgi:hypothetical protein
MEYKGIGGVCPARSIPFLLYITNIIGDIQIISWYSRVMRRVLLVGLFLASSIGLFVSPSGADPATPANVVLSFDFSDNGAAASASGANFNIITDVLPEHTGGVVRMLAYSPDSSTTVALLCDFQPVVQSQVECGFNFTEDGVWTIKSQYATDTKSAVSSVSITRLRVSN